MMYQALMLGLIFCCFLCLYRIFRGPTAADRAVAVDILGIVVVGFCAILVVFTRRNFLMDIAIAWTLQSYIAVLALAKYLEGKSFDE
ncbi:monovalent cation/H+ antiporter complex subunit F [Candidatus Margulisiibacteriota bacterium]